MFYKIKPKSKMRNKDLGDWDDNGNITVADTGCDDYNFLIAIHEAIEWKLCQMMGITDKEVTAWDKKHKKMGDDPDAPYHKQHVFAENIERLLAFYLLNDWKEYEKHLDKL